MKVFIPSKDRPAQLQCLLESIGQNLPNMKLDATILWIVSDRKFESGYEKLCHNMKDVLEPDFHFEDEYSFEDQFVQFLEDSGNEPVMLLTDDCVFYRKHYAEENEIAEIMADEKVWCFSYRLGLNTTTQWYRTGQQQLPLDALGCDLISKNENKYVRWNWKVRPYFENYGYMMSWDGHVYRAADLLKIAKQFSFYNPRTFEDKATKNLNDRMANPRKYMVAPQTSCLFVNTINAVQGEAVPFGDKYQISPAELNEKYLSGEVIDMSTFDGLELSGSHDEIPLKFRKV